MFAGLALLLFPRVAVGLDICSNLERRLLTGGRCEDSTEDSCWCSMTAHRSLCVSSDTDPNPDDRQPKNYPQKFEMGIYVVRRRALWRKHNLVIRCNDLPPVAVQTCMEAVHCFFLEALCRNSQCNVRRNESCQSIYFAVVYIGRMNCNVVSTIVDPNMIGLRHVWLTKLTVVQKLKSRRS